MKKQMVDYKYTSKTYFRINFSKKKKLQLKKQKDFGKP